MNKILLIAAAAGLMSVTACGEDDHSTPVVVDNYTPAPEGPQQPGGKQPPMPDGADLNR